MSTALRTGHADHASMTPGRIANAYWTEARYAAVRFVRLPALAVPTLLFPMLFYVLVGYLFGVFELSDPNAARYVFTGFATMAAITPGIFSFGIGLALEREQGLFTLKRALPMPPMAALLASTAMSVLAAVGGALVLALAALALGTVDLSPATLTAVIALVGLGAIPFCAIGLWLGVMLCGRAAPPVVNIAYMAMIYFSGLFIPLPEAIRVVTLASPAFYLHQLMLPLAGAPGQLLGGVFNHALVLGGTTVLCLCLAARRLERAG